MDSSKAHDTAHGYLQGPTGSERLRPPIRSRHGDMAESSENHLATMSPISLESFPRGLHDSRNSPLSFRQCDSVQISTEITCADTHVNQIDSGQSSGAQGYGHLILPLAYCTQSSSEEFFKSGRVGFYLFNDINVVTRTVVDFLRSSVFSGLSHLVETGQYIVICVITEMVWGNQAMSRSEG